MLQKLTEMKDLNALQETTKTEKISNRTTETKTAAIIATTVSSLKNRNPNRKNPKKNRNPSSPKNPNLKKK